MEEQGVPALVASPAKGGGKRKPCEGEAVLESRSLHTGAFGHCLFSKNGIFAPSFIHVLFSLRGWCEYDPKWKQFFFVKKKLKAFPCGSI